MRLTRDEFSCLDLIDLVLKFEKTITNMVDNADEFTQKQPDNAYRQGYKQGLKDLGRIHGKIAQIADNIRLAVCEDSKIQEYHCQIDTKCGFGCDYCLVGEVKELNASGIITIGSCCGHTKHKPYIQVSPMFVSKMLDRGYIQQPADEFGNGKWCFEPKTILPEPEEENNG